MKKQLFEPVIYGLYGLFALVFIIFFYYIAQNIHPSYHYSSSLITRFLVAPKAVFNQNLFVQLCLAFGIYSLFVLRYIHCYLPSLEDIFWGGLLLVSIICFVLGINIELFQTQKFYIFSDRVVLLSAIQDLFSSQHKDYLLGLVLLLFTILFPIAKYLMLSLNLFEPKLASRAANWVNHLGKWSMIDVFIVATALFTLKFKFNLIKVNLKSGLIYFTLAVILSQIIAWALSRKAKKALVSKGQFTES